MKQTKYCKLVLIIGSWMKNVDCLSFSLGCARWNRPMQLAFGVFSAWWKMSASENMLFYLTLFLPVLPGWEVLTGFHPPHDALEIFLSERSDWNLMTSGECRRCMRARPMTRPTTSAQATANTALKQCLSLDWDTISQKKKRLGHQVGCHGSVLFYFLFLFQFFSFFPFYFLLSVVLFSLYFFIFHLFLFTLV